MVMGGDSCSKGLEFESRHSILDGQFFTYLFDVPSVFEKTKINEKRLGLAHFFIKMKQFILQSNKSFCSLIGLLFVFINNNRKVQFNNNFKIYPSGI